MSMAHALEVRVPFCDHVLVEALAPLSSGLKMPGALQKGLFRWAMRNELPNSVLVHRKVGFNPPIAHWLKRELHEVVEQELGERAVKDAGLFVPQAVAELRREFRDGRGDAAHELWALLAAQVWARWLASRR
jgi:asparagine synthase (glutamine-hydrolysing)